MGALTQYMKPKTPPPNPWIEKNKVSEAKKDEAANGEREHLHRTTSLTDLKLQDEPPVKSRAARRPPSRRLVRHVLRARVEAINALAGFFDHLQRMGASGSDSKVKASVHLARLYGGMVVSPSQSHHDGGITDSEQGYRSVKEIVSFLKDRGAKIPTLRHGRFEEEWAASSDAEGYSTTEEKL